MTTTKTTTKTTISTTIGTTTTTTTATTATTTTTTTIMGDQLERQEKEKLGMTILVRIQFSIFDKFFCV